MSERAQPLLALVVDDDEPERRELVKLLVKLGFSVREARNGREAIEALERERFNAVVLDILMPVVDGFDVMKHLRKENPGLLATTVVVSRLNEGDLKVFFPEVRVVQKPPQEEELQRILTGIRDGERGGAI
jgi:CheY-like chemotaxis protein